MKKKMPLLGPLELEIMKVLWELEDAAVSEVVEHLPARPKRHHNTVMTVMKRLADKGVLTQYARDGRTKGYRPNIGREELGHQYMELVREQFFGGSTTETIAAFLGREKISTSQFSKLKKLLGGEK